MQISEIAKALGYDGEYKIVFPVLSKLVHPTGLSICLPEITDTLMETLYSMACWYFNEAFVKLDAGLKQLKLPSLT